MKFFIAVLSVSCLLFFCNESEGALVVMKNGNKVEGKFLSAANNEIQMEIASQIVKIKVSEISYISFDGKQQAGLAQKQNVDQDLAKNALRSLKSLQSIVRTGPTYNEYKRRLGETTIVVDEFLNSTKTTNSEAKKLVSAALGYFMTAEMAWEIKIYSIENGYYELPKSPFCNSCQYLQDFLNEYQAMHKKTNSSIKWDIKYEGVVISNQGPTYLWKCADQSIEGIDKIIK